MSRAKVDRREVLKTTVAGTAGLGLASAMQAASGTVPVPAIGAGRVQVFDSGWRFRRGEGDGFAAPILDDSGWHDELDGWTLPQTDSAPGQPMTVRLYTSAERLELQLNGHTVSKPEREGKPGVAEFIVPYVPGVIEAVAWRGARVVARRRLETAGVPAGLRLRAKSPVARP